MFNTAISIKDPKIQQPLKTGNCCLEPQKIWRHPLIILVIINSLGLRLFLPLYLLCVFGWLLIDNSSLKYFLACYHIPHNFSCVTCYSMIMNFLGKSSGKERLPTLRNMGQCIFISSQRRCTINEAELPKIINTTV